MSLIWINLGIAVLWSRLNYSTSGNNIKLFIYYNLFGKKCQNLNLLIIMAKAYPFKFIPHTVLSERSPAKLMLLTFVWDETASRTARSKIENGLHS